MKPPNFEYFDPDDLQEALALLEQHGDEAKVLAGGQSLMPLLNMRLLHPKVVVDINRISRLANISPSNGGGLAIGAMTRQVSIERSTVVQEQNPLLAAVIPCIGHFQIRNRGTIGGSIVHADPAAELPAITVTLESEFVLERNGNRRVVKAEDFFVDYLQTDLKPTELLTEIRIPPWPSGWGWGFEEVCRRAGDFALVGAVALVHLDPNQICQGTRITLFGVSGTPVRMRRAESALVGSKINERTLKEVSRMVSEDLDPQSDLHASADYRKEVGGVLSRRALRAAATRAKQGIAA